MTDNVIPFRNNRKPHDWTNDEKALLYKAANDSPFVAVVELGMDDGGDPWAAFMDHRDEAYYSVAREGGVCIALNSVGAVLFDKASKLEDLLPVPEPARLWMKQTQ